MKAVILVGGLGTRVSEETDTKPMIEIGGKPILWHIMKMYSTHGVTIGNPSYPISQAFESLAEGF
ncbi:MAG: glucose-phosphate cytidylyltransferase [Pseudomonadota bacterium]|jgi:glucose-1-phosphate cytidylyltransferase